MQYEAFTCEYVQRLIDGEQETEQQFVSYFSELLRIKLRRALRNDQAVEDARQETFLRVLHVLKRKQGLTNPEKLGAFVNGVCSNVLIEYYRSLSRHSSPPEQRVDVPEAGPDPEAEYVSEERKWAVRQILEQLPDRDRKILRLLFLEEKEKDEVCRICGVNRDYLRVLLHRAKNRFREGASKSHAATGTF